MSSKDNKALTPSGMNHRIHLEGVTYSDYIHESAELIRAGRVDLSGASPEKIRKYVNANAPSESRPSVPTRHGILLVHGLTSSPMGMSSLHRYFADRHYLVRSLLLPGHGTRPGDLLDITYQDCLEVCRFGIRTLREEVDYVSVIGFSAGSALAIYLAQTEASIDNLVLLAPALALNNPFSSLYASLLYPFRRWFPNINWPILNKEDDYAKYQSIPINAICQVTKLMKAIRQIKQPLTIPIYMASTTDDETISHQHAINFFIKQTNPLNRGIIYTTNHDLKLPPSLSQRTSCYRNDKILDFSHTSLPVSSHNPHYGKEGDYVDFVHYAPQKKPQKHQQHLVYHGSLSKKNLNNHPIQRLSYNPDFDYMAADMERFLEECFETKIAIK